jgi:hypothetical protein
MRAVRPRNWRGYCKTTLVPGLRVSRWLGIATAKERLMSMLLKDRVALATEAGG